VNLGKFRAYRNLYNTLVRKSKTKYFEDDLLANVKNSKKNMGIIEGGNSGFKTEEKN